MKLNAVFANVGRGRTVNETDLIQVLEQNLIKGAVLDVFEQEPLNENSKLYQLDNVIICPHSADLTNEYFHELMHVFLSDFQNYIQNTHFDNLVDINKGY